MEAQNLPWREVWHAKADNALKNKAINKLAPKLVNETEFPDWSKDQDLLAYLKQFR